MKRKRLITALGIGIVVAIMSSLPMLGRTQQSQSGVGQSLEKRMMSVRPVDRYKLFYSPHNRSDTFLLDTITSEIFESRSDSEGNTTFQEVKRIDSGQMISLIKTDLEAGRYTITFSPHLRRDTFLVDTREGRIWQEASGKDGATIFQPVNRDVPVHEL